MGSFQIHFTLLLLISCYIISLSNAYTYSAGGKDGWILNPSESYDSWSSRQRFNVNDTITFKYTKGVDSVLVVNKNDYDTCNINNPINKMDDGNSVFKLDKSGPFYFISGNKSNCDQGQKLSLVVISPKSHKSSSPIASPPAPIAMPPTAAMSPEIPAMPSAPPMMSGGEGPMSMPGMGSPVTSASAPSGETTGAPAPASFAVGLAPVAVWVVASLALGTFVTAL